MATRQRGRRFTVEEVVDLLAMDGSDLDTESESDSEVEAQIKEMVQSTARRTSPDPGQMIDTTNSGARSTCPDPVLVGDTAGSGDRSICPGPEDTARMEHTADSTARSTTHDPATIGETVESSYGRGTSPNVEETDMDLPEHDNYMSSGESDDEEYQVWTNSLHNFPLVPPFTGTPGFNVNISDLNEEEPSAFDFFELFMDRDTFLNFRNETNRYAAQQIDLLQHTGQMKPQSLLSNWKSVSIDELRCFFAIIFHMCLVKKPQINDYWSTNPVLQSTFAKKLMARDRFKAILQVFHLNNNNIYIPAGQPGHDPLFKVQPFYDKLLEKFQRVYTVQQNISIDESICPFKGRIRFRIYMPKKTHKWGLKFYQLCESGSGYIWSYELHCGREGVSYSPSDVVLRLIEPLLDKGYTVYCDNYYTSPALFDTLQSRETMAVGTARSNRRGMPTEVRDANLNRGEVVFRRRNNLLAMKWKDKRDVTLLSTKHKPNMVQVATRHEEPKLKPEAIHEYNCNMAGVDHADQLISYMPFHRKTIKWWKKLFFHMVCMAAINAYILYKKHLGSQSRISLEQFFTQISQGLVDAARKDVRGEDTARSPVCRLTGRHFPSNITPTEKQPRPRRPCKVCHDKAKKEGQGLGKTQRKRKDTNFWCLDCGVPL